MRKLLLTVVAALLMPGSNIGAADAVTPHRMEHAHAMNTTDTRISLGLSPQMKQHQLANMREHVQAIKDIVGLMADKKFGEASGIAHAKLGLTPEMQSMCNMFDNEDFRKRGFAFHKSGDDLGDALQSGDVNGSLRALNSTMQYCVECHATYRQ